MMHLITGFQGVAGFRTWENERNFMRQSCQPHALHDDILIALEATCRSPGRERLSFCDATTYEEYEPGCSGHRNM